MACNCNDGSDCNRNCSNPCNVSITNTVECESIDSQITNFTKQFFGTVIKTEVDGVISWSLPCNLDVGLENNPRNEDEGLACYFLRLFQEGIVGLTGPQGDKGDAGTNGHNAYTVTLQSFTQPSLGSPNVTVISGYNPAILPGLYIFIATSGWYVVNGTDGNGSLFLTLTRPLVGAPAVIPAGKLVVPSGYPGESVVGPQGPKGDKGDTGDQATAFTTNNDQYDALVGTDYKLQIAYAAVDFTNSAPEVLLSSAGRYLVSVVADLVGITGVVSGDVVTMKLRNTTLNSDVEGSEHELSNLIDTERKQMVIICIVETDSDNQTISLFGKCTSADHISVVALNTTITYVQLE